jgi:integrase
MTFLGISQDQDQYLQLIKGKSVSNIEDDIHNFITSLGNRHYTLNSQKAYLNAIIHLYTMNNIILNRKILARYLSNDDVSVDDELQQEHDKPYTREQIARLLEFATDLRTKVMILLMASAGLRVGALELPNV